MSILDIVFVLVVGAMCIGSFWIGAKIGQMIVKGEDIKLPSPMKAFREREERREAVKEQNKIDTIMRNIENYNGTPFNQEDVPK